MDNLLAQSLAEIFLIACLAVVRKRKHQNGISTDERRSRGPFRNRALQRLESGRVAALRDVDYQIVAWTFLAIIAGQLSTQASRLDAHDRVVPWVEGVVLAKYLDPDHKF